jgi:hypothetical protein
MGKAKPTDYGTLRRMDPDISDQADVKEWPTPESSKFEPFETQHPSVKGKTPLSSLPVYGKVLRGGK